MRSALIANEPSELVRLGIIALCAAILRGFARGSTWAMLVASVVGGIAGGCLLGLVLLWNGYAEPWPLIGAAVGGILGDDIARIILALSLEMQRDPVGAWRRVWSAYRGRRVEPPKGPDA